MTITEGQKTIVKDLRAAGLIRDEKPLEQEVGICWRCDTPIEVVNAKQWFMRTTAFSDQIIEQAKKIIWYPDFMRYRLIDWTKSLDWDWVLSRQRVFATPVPVWYCKQCGEIHLAEPEELPVDTKITQPRGKCAKCGSSEFIPDYDVMDTWFDSSLTCAIHAGWPDKKDWHNLFPASIHPSGQDIIRTWAYYLMVRHLALFGEPAYNSVLINGMVLGSDGRKMSKSLGNFVNTPEVFGKQGADAARQWAASGGSTGTDIPFRWEDVEYGRRFMTKLWNACRFSTMRMEDYNATTKVEPQLIDRWILSKLEKTVKASTEAMENCEWMNATEVARNFTWHILCDDYLEAAKYRLYGEGEPRHAAQKTLHQTNKKTLQHLAPVIPHLTEEIYNSIYAESEDDSIHTSRWPEYDASMVDEEAERIGDAIMAVISQTRKQKNKLGIPLNKPVKKLTVYAVERSSFEDVKLGLRDITEAMKCDAFDLEEGIGEVPVEGVEGLSITLTLS